VFAARWAYDGSAQGGKKTGYGNTWVVAAIVVRLRFCPSPVALPVLFRLWRGTGTASPVELAAQLVTVLAGAFPGRQVHGTGDAAFHGESLAAEGTTWTTRLPASAVLHGPRPPPAGKRGRPRQNGDRIGTCADAAQHADRRDTVIRAYGKDENVQVACCQALRHGSFRSAPGQFLLIREPGSAKPCDLGLFTLDTQASPEALADRYSRRRAIEPSNATGKQLTGAGDACNRGPESRRAHRPVRVPCPVPDDHLGQPSPATPPPASGAAAAAAPGTAPRPRPHPPTCTPPCALSSPTPELTASAQVTTTRDKSPTAR
jgi:hypothetical protein